MGHDCPECGATLRERRPNFLNNIRRRDIESRYDRFVCTSCETTYAKDEILEEDDKSVNVMSWMKGVQEPDGGKPMDFVELVQSKEWFWEDDSLIEEEVTSPDGEVVERVFWWVTESYLTSAQREKAFQDDDVEQGVLEEPDLESGEWAFGIALYPVTEEGDPNLLLEEDDND